MMTGKTVANRYNGEGGLFVKGNPGKPIGSKHMTTKLREAITKINDGTKTAEDVEILTTLIKKAKQGDMQAMKLIFNYMDGMPAQAPEDPGSKDNPMHVEVTIKQL